MSGNDNDNKKELTDKVGELESLMSQTPPILKETSDDSRDIPILDELVNPDEYDEIPDDHDEQEIAQDQIEDIAERVERKLSMELDEIVELLKGTLKDSIMTELHDQIKKDTDKESDS